MAKKIKVSIDDTGAIEVIDETTNKPITPQDISDGMFAGHKVKKIVNATICITEGSVCQWVLLGGKYYRV